MKKLPKISDGQAQVIIGLGGLAVAVLALYYTKKAASSAVDAVENATKAAVTAVNPTSDKNLAYKATSGLLGEDFVIDKIGGGVASIVDWWKK